MSNADISVLLPLQPGCFIAVLHPHKSNKVPPEVRLGEVLTMYTHTGAHGAKHEWTSLVNMDGNISYLNIRVFHPSHGFTFTSLASPALKSAIFLHILPTHILFSFAASSSLILHHDITTDDAHPFALVTLCPASGSIMQSLRGIG
ncbi:hypothetical protein BDN67DRAFT_1016109 [Paxillus ammoniavirescens]|nr:hypothetical protein BDN67DRAFT_1016109 [Paxillus ammoniavirescens]